MLQFGPGVVVRLGIRVSSNLFSVLSALLPLISALYPLSLLYGFLMFPTIDVPVLHFLLLQ